MSEQHPLTNVTTPQFVENAADKILDQPSTAISRVLGDLVFLVFGDLFYEADKLRTRYQVGLEQFKTSLEQEVSNIPEEKRIEPDIQTACAALEAVKHCVTNDEVREMFVQLLAASVNSDKCSLAHPSFPQIIKQLNSFDAALLKLFTYRGSYGICNYHLIPTETPKSYQRIMVNVFIPDASTPAEAVGDYAASITLLERLGLISITYSANIHPDDSSEDEYSKYEKCDYFKIVSETFKENGRLTVVKGIAELTPIGVNLLRVCFPDFLNNASDEH